MQLHQLQPKHKARKGRRIGRGGKRGTYSGRGLKGQRSRSGRRLKPIIREWIKRYPKLRGYKFQKSGRKIEVVNIADLQDKFKSGELVSPQALFQSRLIRRIGGKMPGVKILGQGALAKKLVIEGCRVSKSAREKIEKAGGQIKNPKR